MRKLTSDEINRATDPRSEVYKPAPNSRSVPPGTSILRVVHLDGEYVQVDPTSFEKVLARLGIEPSR